MKLIGKINPQVVFWTLFVVLFIIWTFTALQRLNETPSLDWDFAQYGFAMFDWRSSGKIPLLGPNAGYVSFNHLPALYYWIIYPFYLITNASVFYNHLACFVYTWAIFLGLALVLRKRPAYRWSFLLLIALFCFSPLILHDRTIHVWNPSYAWQPVVVAWYCLALASQSKRRILLRVIGGIACAISISFNLSLIPVVIGLLVVSVVRLRRQVLPWLIGFLVASLILWSPIFILQPNEIFASGLPLSGQSFDPFTVRFYNLFTASLTSVAYGPKPAGFELPLGCILVIAPILFQLGKHKLSKLLHQDWFQLLLILVISAIITLIPRVNMNYWYATGTAAIIILLLTNSPGRFKYIAIALLMSYWLMIFLRNIQPATGADTASTAICLSKVCQYTMPNQYYYAFYTDAVGDNAPSYFLTTLGCPPTRRWQKHDLNTLLENMVSTDYPLLVFHDLDELRNEWRRWPKETSDQLYVELKPTLDKLYQHPIVSASCDDNWGWTLYSKSAPPTSN